MNPSSDLHPGDSHSILRTSPRIRWVRDVDFVILVDEVSDQRHILEGEEALVWEWLHMGMTINRCAALLAKMNEVAGSLFETMVIDLISRWMDEGWIHLEGEIA